MTDIDPITLEVVTQGLISVVCEMRATVFRTARSVAIYEARDFSCGLFDAGGQVVAQSEDIGSHVVPLPWSVEASLERLGPDLAPGDVVVTNDSYLGGTHLNDVMLIYPIFDGDIRVFFAAVREHWADVGGAVPGSMSGSATEIYQEGTRIPPVKLVERGRMNQAAMEILLVNMRVPEERLGDFNSGLAACRTAERRARELIERHILSTLHTGVRRNLNRSEARMRAQIEKLPDGVYHYEDYLETFGPAPEYRLEPLLLPLALTVHGDSLTADFTGAAEQAPAPVNSSLAVTAASVFITLKAVFDPTKEFVHYERSSGGNDGCLEADGPSAMAAIGWGDLSTVQPTEVLEAKFPLDVEWSRQATDSGGPGRTRGGRGTRRSLKLARGNARYSLLSDGAMVPPYGILGGDSGAPVASYTDSGDGLRPFPTPGKVGGHPMAAGDRIVLQSAGGGGYGDPLERAPETVLDDVEEGYVSIDAARDLYGVIIDGGAVDTATTKRPRAELCGVRRTLTVEPASEAAPFESVGRGRKRIARLHPGDATGLDAGENEMIELLGDVGAPLRAWVRVEPDARLGAVPLDERGRRALRIEPRASVWVRTVHFPGLE